MKAARIHTFGGADVLQIDEIDVPTPKPGEVLIRVVASSINPIEWKIRSGAMAKAIGRDPPVTLGWDCSGVVERTGGDGARFRAGDAVMTYPEFGAGGTHAEYVVVKADQVALKPSTISFADAAALPMAGGAAWQCIVAVGAVEAGKRVLIHAASGGVGTIAVQLAKARGAIVYATTSRENLSLVRDLGADEVIDYQSSRFEAVARDMDLVVDLLGGETQLRSWSTLKPGGLLVGTATPPDQERAKTAGVRTAFIYTPPRGDLLAEIGAMVDAFKIRPVIGQEFGLWDVRKAHALSESGRSRGKIVLHVGTP